MLIQQNMFGQYCADIWLEQQNILYTITTSVMARYIYVFFSGRRREALPDYGPMVKTLFS